MWSVLSDALCLNKTLDALEIRRSASKLQLKALRWDNADMPWLAICYIKKNRLLCRVVSRGATVQALIKEKFSFEVLHFSRDCCFFIDNDPSGNTKECTNLGN